MDTLLPKEIVDYIYKIKHSIEMKDVCKEINLKIPGIYVIVKKSIYDERIEQIVNITFTEYIKENDLTLYNYDYGVFGFHEGCCTRDEIRRLTFKEKINSQQRKFWELPQQFYQS